MDKFGFVSYVPSVENGWQKTVIASDRPSGCFGLALASPHAVAVLKEKTKNENHTQYFHIHIAFSSTPSTGPWRLNTIARDTDFKPCERDGVAVGNDFCVVAGASTFRRFIGSTAMRVYFFPVASLEGEWHQKDLFTTFKDECRCSRVVFAGEYFFVLGKGMLDPSHGQPQPFVFCAKDPRNEWKGIGVAQDTGTDAQHSKEETFVKDLIFTDGEYVALLTKSEEYSKGHWTHSLRLIHAADPATFSPSFTTLEVKAFEGGDDDEIKAPMISYGNGRFIIMSTRSQRPPRVFVSPFVFGTWREVTMPPDSPSRIQSLFFADDMFVVSGISISSKPSIAFSSSPLREWNVGQVDRRDALSLFSLFSLEDKKVFGVFTPTRGPDTYHPVCLSRSLPPHSVYF